MVRKLLTKELVLSSGISYCVCLVGDSGILLSEWYTLCFLGVSAWAHLIHRYIN